MTNRPIIQLDWSIEGLKFAIRNNDIVVIVDTLRFSSAVVTAVANGFTIYPTSDKKKGAALAAKIGAEMSGRPGKAKYSISPLSYMNVSDEENKEVVLCSPNGAACSELVAQGDSAFVGCLLNALKVAEHVSKLAKETKKNVMVIAAGEQRAIDTGERIVYVLKKAYRVFAIEDYLGAGAIIFYSGLRKKPEAQVCARAFEASKNDLEGLLRDSFSGRYLVQNNLIEDVRHAAQLNSYDVIPVIRDKKITCLRED
jgi:2-phosphosulfolactate phosphatase